MATKKSKASSTSETGSTTTNLSLLVEIGSLRDALNAAAGNGDTIDFAPMLIGPTERSLTETETQVIQGLVDGVRQNVEVLKGAIQGPANPTPTPPVPSPSPLAPPSPSRAPTPRPPRPRKKK